ncbi:MAG: formate--tetrahydrofolate ligase [Armatimonadetes bacterium]|nr:formate--tetrahydrofolate ligase [Candidatus Hippobium faecium]
MTDIEIAQKAIYEPIEDIAGKLDIEKKYLMPYGRNKAKIDINLLKDKKDNKEGKLVIVTAITPTPAGEGKTTTLIGVADALRRIGEKSAIAMREPSLGPCFGIKGGACGGGYAQVIPMEDINLHFTGDFHAITSAHNLLSAMIDNHIYQGNELDIDISSITWKRVLDMNDRALRNIVIGLGGRTGGVPRESGFEITTASEVMALFCLSEDFEDLRKRLANIVIGKNRNGEPVTAKDLKAHGAMAALLKDAIHPNLVQSLEGTPAFVHGGPFANIAHGCNSLIATKTALKCADWVITEGGFGSDLGCEKFFDIKCRTAGLKPSGAILVATIKAIKIHGGQSLKDISTPNTEALKAGFENVVKHVENIRSFGIEPIIALNKFPTDTQEEENLFMDMCREYGFKASLSDVWAKGGAGALEIAQMLKETETVSLNYSYDTEDTIEKKISDICTKIYGAEGISLSAEAKKSIKEIEGWGMDKLPVCIAKTQYSFSDNAKLLNRPKGFTVQIRGVKLSGGAGFIVVYAGNIMTMPGLPKIPAANNISTDENSKITGLF